MSALPLRATAAQTRMEIRLTLRRGENLLVTLIIPLALLVFFAWTNPLPATSGLTLDFLVPGILALAIVSTGMVNLGIATAYERHYGVLKRLGGSPLPHGGLLAAKALAIVALEIAQVGLVVAVATIGLGWQPRILFIPVALAVAVGTLTFCGIGLAMAGALRAEATLALANGLYLMLLLLGNLVLPIGHLPGWLQPVSRILPSTALSNLLRFAFGSTSTVPTLDAAALIAWMVLAGYAAISWFRWE
jgi:ABC-2 type transport system permease protein